MDRLGIGPKTFGTVTRDGEVYTVLEYIDGANINDVKNAPPGMVLTNQILDEAKKKYLLLKEVGLYPLDFQFMFTRQGKVTVIDPAFFGIDLTLLEKSVDPTSRSELDELGESFLKYEVDQWKKAGKFVSEPMAPQ